MLSNGTMNEARAQVAQGRVDPTQIKNTGSSGVEEARERLGQLNSLLVEIQMHLEQQVSRICGPVPERDSANTSVGMYGGALGDLHSMIDVLFETTARIGIPAARLDQI